MMNLLLTLLPPLIAVPDGPFLMGTPLHALSDLARQYGGTRESYREETPQHELALPAFWIARTPVSNALYGLYVAATQAPAPLRWRGPTPPAALADHPVVDINWHEAQAFCHWLADQWTPPPGVGVPRLPSEAEWERAARGLDGRSFPWGEGFTPSLANTRESGLATTSPLGAYPAGASPAGGLDLAGNVWEWTASLDQLYPYRADDGREDPLAPGRRIMRGGCYANPHGYARCACRFRLLPTVRNEFTGFRFAAASIT
ncbi:MAG: formylglycine-generating enzyme family protein [Oscillochloridaceae bacterium umkhey_bin13]